MTDDKRYFQAGCYALLLVFVLGIIVGVVVW